MADVNPSVDEMKDAVEDITIRGLAALIKGVKSEQVPKLAVNILLKAREHNAKFATQDKVDDGVDIPEPVEGGEGGDCSGLDELSRGKVIKSVVDDVTGRILKENRNIIDENRVPEDMVGKVEAGEAIGASTSEPQVHVPEVPPARDWRGANDKKDHGYAARQQYLNTPPPRYNH